MIINVLEYLEESAGKYPDKAAFVDSDKELTFGQLHYDAQAAGTTLLSLNVTHRPVVVLMEKSADNIGAFMGILYSGNFYCPIDTAMPIERLKIIMKTLEPVAILTDKENEDKIMRMDLELPYFIYHDIISGEIDQAGLDGIRKGLVDTDPAYVLFTSGSTGIPKGVLISHKSIIDFTDWMTRKFDITYKDNFGNQSPFYFDLSIGDLYCTLKNGCTNFIIPKKLFVFPVKLIEYLNEKEINIIFWIPSALCIVANLKALNIVKPKYLDRVLFCGEVMPNKQLNVWRKALPKVKFVNLYGPCEAVDACTYYVVDRDFADDESLPIGIPCENTEIIVLNDADQLVTGDETGELCIKGSSLALGYYNNFEKTEAAFVQNPLNKSYPEKIYRTGDLVKYNQYGELIYVSRKDYQIKYMGYRIELGEIEVAAGGIEGIETCACIYDDEKQKIVFFYKGAIYKDDVLEEAFGKKIPEYMIPNVNIWVKEFPYNANGKIDRKRLKGVYKNGKIEEFR